ncbi:MAG: RnfABCDGE type electron transport complex subunit B [Spirochaetales bacterium]|nr:RnfABCDGE type electron transport complex subunit B [Spirochaetales bacterium]
MVDIILRILFAFLSISALGALLGFGLAVAARKLRVERDKTVESLMSSLPGLNCGACGYPGCEGYAEALASGQESNVTKCSPGGAEVRQAVAQTLGVEAGESGPRQVARLACLGGDGIALRDFQYAGYSDCEAAKVHFDGDKGCKHGCLGLGSCVKSCPVDAISYTENGLVRVDEEKCIGCEVCVTVCPTGAMHMVDAESKWFVACNSTDKAKATKAVCSAGCIGCRICERKFPEAGFKVEDNLSVLAYTKESGEGRREAAEACPVKCIIRTKD